MLHLYQSWVSHVSIHHNCHVVILIKCKSLKILIESTFKAPNVTLFVHLITTCRCFCVSIFGNSQLIFFLFKNDGSDLVGLLIHFLIAENFINILVLKNDGTTQQIFHLRFTYIITLKKI
jgi:hypothetical protein